MIVPQAWKFIFTGADLWRPEMIIRFCETESELSFSCYCLHGGRHTCQQAVWVVGWICSICHSWSTFYSFSNLLCPSRKTFMDCLYGFLCPLASTCFWPVWSPSESYMGRRENKIRVFMPTGPSLPSPCGLASFAEDYSQLGSQYPCLFRL